MVSDFEEGCQSEEETGSGRDSDDGYRFIHLSLLSAVVKRKFGLARFSTAENQVNFEGYAFYNTELQSSCLII